MRAFCGDCPDEREDNSADKAVIKSKEMIKPAKAITILFVLLISVVHIYSQNAVNNAPFYIVQMQERSNL